MKRLAFAAAIFALIIIICIISNIFVCKSIKSAKKEIKECSRLYSEERFDEAQKTAEKFKKHWDKIAKSISAYSNHCTLDDISILSAVLYEAAKHQNDYEFYSTAAQIQTALKSVLNEQTFTLESLY